MKYPCRMRKGTQYRRASFSVESIYAFRLAAISMISYSETLT